MRALVSTLLLVMALAFAAPQAMGEEQPQKAPAAAAPAAPDSGKAGEAAGSCMPGGECCGQGACKHAAKMSDKASGDAEAGGCPCMKNKAMKKGS